MTVHIISNPERLTRVAQLHNEMKRQGITDYRLWPSVHIANKPKRTGISYAHKQIVEWLMLEGIEEGCIMEDDVWFPATDGFNYFIENKPKDFDQYLGGVTRGKIENGITPRYTGQFCYIIHENYYTKFLDTNEMLDIDGGQSGKGKFYVCEPFACFCYPGWSENAAGNMDYSHLLIGREVRGFGKVQNMSDAKSLSDLAKKHAAH